VKGAYRETEYVSVSSFSELKARVDELEREPPKKKDTPAIRIWHTLFGGLASLLASIFAQGLIFDSYLSAGTKFSTQLSLGAFSLFSFIVLIASCIKYGERRSTKLTDAWGE
jgi:hypothetical protein